MKDFKDLTPNLAHAHFSLGRLAEGSKEYGAAVEHYEKLSANFADSDWTRLAKDRIIYLKASSAAKSEIFLKQEAIMAELEKELSGLRRMPKKVI